MPTYTNIGGSQKEVTNWYANVGGALKELNNMYANVGGAQKEIFSKETPKKLMKYTFMMTDVVQCYTYTADGLTGGILSGSTYTSYLYDIAANQMRAVGLGYTDATPVGFSGHMNRYQYSSTTGKLTYYTEGSGIYKANTYVYDLYTVRQTLTKSRAISSTEYMGTGISAGTYEFLGNNIYYYDYEQSAPTDTQYTVTNNLTNCTTSNSLTAVTAGSSYNTAISFASNYKVDTYSVTMGGVDVTNYATVGVSGVAISIPNVTGNIVITVSCSLSVQTTVNRYTVMISPQTMDIDYCPYAINTTYYNKYLFSAGNLTTYVSPLSNSASVTLPETGRNNLVGYFTNYGSQFIVYTGWSLGTMKYTIQSVSQNAMITGTKMLSASNVTGYTAGTYEVIGSSSGITVYYYGTI